MKVGYGGYTQDFKGPGDRRRFCAYAQARKIQYEYADRNKNYDLVYLTYNSDLSYWIKQKELLGDRLIIIFEIIDSYLAEPLTIKSSLRGVTRFLLKTNSKLVVNFTSVIKKMCNIADAVVCSTLEQKLDILKYNENVHISFDYFDAEIKTVKTNINGSPKIKLVWEGQPYTLDNINVIDEALNLLKDEVELHIITDLTYFKYFKKYLKRETQLILKNIECDMYFHEWNKETFHKIITNCDLAIIPINLNDSFQKGKPENKLVLLWKMGMPVITSDSPAYTRCMQDGQINMTVKNDINDWVEKIRQYTTQSTVNKVSLQSEISNYVKKSYSAEVLFKKWDELFDSVQS